ncbi:MAG: STAS/SEC14 domain-containing protein [Proteobacteria bacterium]|nr:STAS/SEC14 domain-containing protein [Pseudomonadota bacterium]
MVPDNQNESSALNTTPFLYERTSWIKHKGQTILVRDYSKLGGEEAIRIVTQHADEVDKKGIRGLLVLVDITDAYANKEVLSAFKNASAKAKPYFKKTAVIGAVGVLKFFLHLVDTFASLESRSFDTKEEALDWLVE